MTKHYWTWPIAIYLFLGGLGGGILALVATMEFFLGGLGETLALAVIISILCLGIGCFFLVFELGQPTVFLRVFISATAIIKWGAILLSIAMFAALFYVLPILPWDLFAFLAPIQTFCLAVAGICGTCIMIYTGVLLSSLKAHSFWSTPALPILFTVSALSTACAAAALTSGMWPSAQGVGAAETVHALLHSLDLVLVVFEIAILLIYVLLLRGAGNECARSVAARWISGSFAPAFWGGMILGGLFIPLLCYLAGGILSTLVAPVLILAGGLLLRFLVVFSDDRRLIAGEKKFYSRLPKGDEAFLTAWKGKENLY